MESIPVASPGPAGSGEKPSFPPPGPPLPINAFVCASRPVSWRSKPGEESRGGLGASPIAGVRPWAG